MMFFDTIKLWKQQRSTETLEVDFKNLPEKLGFKKNLDYYNLPLTDDEVMIIKHSSVDECDIKDLQCRLKRKLRYSELQILKITSDNGIMIRDGDFGI